MGDEVSLSNSSEGREGLYRLVRDPKVIQERVVWYNWALSDKCRTIGIVGGLLKEAMPVLM